jgi:hypothetical protein
MAMPTVVERMASSVHALLTLEDETFVGLRFAQRPNFARALAGNQGSLATSRTTRPPTRAPPHAAPIEIHKHISNMQAPQHRSASGLYTEYSIFWT